MLAKITASLYTLIVMRNKKSVIRTIALLVALILLNCMSLSAYADQKIYKLPESVHISKCIIIVGDSRTSSLVGTINSDKNYKLLYYRSEPPELDAIFLKDNVLIAICSESAGYLDNGAFERAFGRMNTLISSDPNMSKTSNYYYFNLFGINDVFMKGMDAINNPAKYIGIDEQIKDIWPQVIKFYQFNAGEISYDGWLYNRGIMNNDIIEKYNMHLKSTEKVNVVDLYSYLKVFGYGTSDDSVDGHTKSGVHYDEETDWKILNLIYSLAE